MDGEEGKIELTPERVRLEALKVASAQHVRMNAVPVTVLIGYAAQLERFIWKGALEVDKDENPLD